MTDLNAEAEAWIAECAGMYALERDGKDLLREAMRWAYADCAVIADRAHLDGSPGDFTALNIAQVIIARSGPG